MKKETWKFVIQTILAVLTAIATSFGVTSCMGCI
ncbi:MAG: smalltalk protein [Bacteroidaceae bacterium]|nr:smalltalk protein [Bacteroidaceae bacterium]